MLFPEWDSLTSYQDFIEGYYQGPNQHKVSIGSCSNFKQATIHNLTQSCFIFTFLYHENETFGLAFEQCLAIKRFGHVNEI